MLGASTWSSWGCNPGDTKQQDGDLETAIDTAVMMYPTTETDIDRATTAVAGYKCILGSNICRMDGSITSYCRIDLFAATAGSIDRFAAATGWID